ncbi:ATP-binding protein, partial [bacterium]|nr:ATP-binding protein [bacterium]
DGKEEVILVGQATGNIHYPAAYSDDRCWLFVLDQDLSPIFEPISFGEYSSRLSCSPIEISKERFLLLSYSYQGDKNQEDFLCLVDSQGRIRPKKYPPNGIVAEGVLAVGPIVDNRSTPPVIYTATKHGDLFRMNEHLSITLQKVMSHKEFNQFEAIVPLHLIDLNGDGNSELICGSYKGLQIFDERLELLASFQVPARRGRISFRKTGEGNPLEIGVNSGEDFYRFAFKKNALFKALPLLWLGLSGLMLLLLAGGYKFSALIHTYLSFFRFSLSKTANGMLILNSGGHISFLNHRVQTLLGFNEPIIKGQHFTEALEEKPELLDLIEKAMVEQRPCNEKVSILKPNYHFEGEVRITPFISRFRILSAYLIAIHDRTESTTLDRLGTWSKTVQKLAHDIKTPLSSVGLNLKMLQMRLEGLPLARRKQVNDHLEMMQTELERVRDMTKSFLKFASLENPHFQVVSSQEIIENAINKFTTFTNDGVQIQTDLDAEVDEIWADPHQIQLVFHILIENAIDALKGHGLIRISTSMAQSLSTPFRKFLELEFSDTGPGIDPRVGDKIFEPYYTSKSEGTGMGLAIARKIIEDHGGRIGLYSRPEFGTVFRFSLPLFEDNSSNKA